VTTAEGAVLVVEDEAHMRRFLRTTLTHNAYHVVEAGTAASALENVFEGKADLVLLDLGLPDMDGVELTARIRERSDIPIIVISARDAEWAKIEALDHGANDYVTKPFSAGELLARMRAALRVAARSGRQVATHFAVGDLSMDLGTRQVFLGTGDAKREVTLTPTEYNLLLALVRAAGRVVTHRELLRAVWGADATGELQYLRVYMRQLRYKLEAEPAQPKYLLTVPGVGYRLKADT
jgi:two-component system KDP operon response regulator KdpE